MNSLPKTLAKIPGPPEELGANLVVSESAEASSDSDTMPLGADAGSAVEPRRGHPPQKRTKPRKQHAPRINE